jgi:hypothetical protein
LYSVSWNRFGQKGAQVFADALRVNRALTVCVLWGNMGPEGDALIRDAVRGKAGFEMRL